MLNVLFCSFVLFLALVVAHHREHSRLDKGSSPWEVAAIVGTINAVYGGSSN